MSRKGGEVGARKTQSSTAVYGIVAALWLAAGGATALASGGPYNPNQQDCTWNSSAWNTPKGYQQPGCHNFALNVESGGTTNGNANSDNTRYLEWGDDQAPNEGYGGPIGQTGNPSFGFILAPGDPGTYTAEHSGCASANTAGSGGGTGTGCGNNADGAGFEANYDYYQFYCPAAALLPPALFTATQIPGSAVATFLHSDTGSFIVPAAYQCAADQPIKQTSVTPDTGTKQALSDVLTKGVLVYFGGDDNNNNGEHDGFSGNDGYPGATPSHTDGAINGPSDTTGDVVSVTPQNATAGPTLTHPEGLVNASGGICADSICTEATTQQRTAYYGCYDPSNPNDAQWKQSGTDSAASSANNQSDIQCAQGTPENQDVYQNSAPSSTSEPADCSAQNTKAEECSDGSSDPNGYRAHTAQQENTEPGVQTFQDPDPQRSPLAGFETPGMYAGTCGAYASPVKNNGYLVSTGCDGHSDPTGAHAGGCALNGTATFGGAGLTVNTPNGTDVLGATFTYAFDGTLSSCNDTGSGPSTGKLSAGERIPIDGVTVQEPKANGGGGCTTSQTTGTAIVQWADKSLTIVDYTTRGALAAVGLNGDVRSSITLPVIDSQTGKQAVDPTTGQPVVDTLHTTRFDGDSALGALAFQPANPTDCQTGVKTATITGALGIGNTSGQSAGATTGATRRIHSQHAPKPRPR
jgi:hypothetical protein